MNSTSQGSPFPSQFLWGTATAAHQVEGGNTNNDWWDWEQIRGHIHDGSRSGDACDQFNRYPSDFALYRSLGQNGHRLSLEWSRLEPEPGRFDPSAFAHYRKVLETLRAEEIEPVVTLHHFTNPRWLAQAGGWTQPEVLAAFKRFVERVVEAYGDIVRTWVTINEPGVYTQLGYVLGVWPPGQHNAFVAARVFRHMLFAHGMAYHTIHRLSPGARVGLSHNVRLFQPNDPGSRWDRWAAAARDQLVNWLPLQILTDGYLRPPFGLGGREPVLAHTLDFVGLNYYTRDRVAFAPYSPFLLGRTIDPPDLQRNTMGWEVYPRGLYDAIRLSAAFGPVLVTENGTADVDDELRPSFLRQSLAAVEKACREGIPVLGYLHWSSVDNFEWAEGFSRRFGLIHVDLETQERRVKASGELYARICRSKGQIVPALENDV